MAKRKYRSRWYASSVAIRRFRTEGLGQGNPLGYTGRAKKKRGIWFFEYVRKR